MPARPCARRLPTPNRRRPLPEPAGSWRCGGRPGAPGRTLVAVNIAGELAAEGKSVLLVDADSYGASVAGALGLLDEAAGLAQACRLADQGLLDAEALLRVAVPVTAKAGTFRVLTGITRADRWTELRAAALALVLNRAREVADFIVVDTGFCLEADEELSFDTMAPRRNAATLRSLELADTVLAVGSADSSRCSPPGQRPGGTGSCSAGVSARGGAEQSAGLGCGPFTGTSAPRGVGPVRPAGGHQSLPSVGPGATDAALQSGSLLLESAPDSRLRSGDRGIGLCTCPAKTPILCLFFHSKARLTG